MPTFELDAGGQKFQVDAPDMQRAIDALHQATAPKGTPANIDFAGRFDPNREAAYSRSSILDPIMQGATLGFSDEIMGGLGGVISTAAGQGFEPGYQKLRDATRQSLDVYRQRNPGKALAGEVAGSLATAAIPVGGAVAEGANLGARILNGIKTGALFGGIYGAGSADGGVADRAAGATEGAIAGGMTGAVLPMAAAGARFIGKPVINAARARINPEGFAASKVAERLASQNRTADQAAGRIDKAAQSGQYMTLADVGGRDVQDLARTAVNVPGPARNRITTKVNIAQMTQGDRLKTAIRGLFADPNAYEATKDGIIAARASAAKPFYDAAYRQPVPFTRDLEGLLQTPAGKAALAAAKTNTANRREPWAQWFASIDQQGNLMDLRRVPDTRALDEVKRALDQMVEAAKAPADGSPFARARATPQSIAIQSVRDDLLKFLDANNPAYAKARSVALDNIQADSALEFGRNALNTDPRVVARQMAKYNDGQREMARIGAAEALRGKIDKAGYTHNAILRIFNSRQQINGLKALFGDPQAFGKFHSFVFNEARRSQTRSAVMGNSTTARQLLDARDAGELADVAEVAHNTAMWGVIPASLSALQKAVRRLGGLTPDVADNIGKLLMTSDPAKVRGILQTIRKIEASKATRAQQASAIRGALTRFLASAETGALTAQQAGQ